MIPWWGWVLIVIAIIIFIIFLCYIFRDHIPFCAAICEICEGIGDGISDIDLDIGGDD